jgi:nicotinate phosphoribosyltransferase
MISPLLTDLYQLTMASGYFRSGRARDEAVFHLFFRTHPFGGSYAIAAGLEAVVDLVEGFRFGAEDIDYLASLAAEEGGPEFGADFLDYLRALRLRVDIDAVPEGSLVFAHEPVLRVRGPLLEAQLLETALLNLINFQTLIATKATRVCHAAAGQPVLEFGLRRAQGIDGGLSASRAAYIGGCDATSNVLAGKRYGIPVRGTHSHSWVMSFDSELESFEAYADAMPDNCLFLVDTYDSLTGVDNAIRVGQQLRLRNERLRGIRLDSGDLAWLSVQARRRLDAAGFRDAVIVASNDLDEHVIESLRHQGSAIGVWGVGTRLVTGYDEPALGGVYKLGLIARAGRPLEPRIKLSEHVAKITTPGLQQVRRFSRAGKWVADAIYDERTGLPAPATIIDPLDPTRRRVLGPELDSEDVLLPALRGGRAAGERPSLAAIRRRAQEQLAALDPSVRRLMKPHIYPVGLSEDLYCERMRLIEAARAGRSPLAGESAGERASEGPGTGEG